MESELNAKCYLVEEELCDAFMELATLRADAEVNSR